MTDNSSNTPISWNWTTTGGTPPSSTSQNPSVTYSAAGTYTVTLVSTNSFGASSPVSHTITVNANPSVPTITLSGNTLTSSSTTGNQWYLNGVLISGATHQSYTTTANGPYTVVVTNSFGCKSTSIATNLTTTGISSFAENAILSIYPNPSNGIITISFVAKSENLTVEVFNDLGQMVYIEKINDCPKDCNKIIDMNSFNKGIYLFRIVADGNIYTKKVLLVK
jgi:PKD repeat protein